MNSEFVNGQLEKNKNLITLRVDEEMDRSQFGENEVNGASLDKKAR